MVTKRQRKTERWQLAVRRRARLTPQVAEEVGAERGWWYESPEEIRRMVERGRVKEALLEWVHRQMRRRLSFAERRGVEMYYLGELSYREVGASLKVSGRAAARLVQGAVGKLRVAAAESELPELTAWREGKGE